MMATTDGRNMWEAYYVHNTINLHLLVLFIVFDVFVTYIIVKFKPFETKSKKNLRFSPSATALLSFKFKTVTKDGQFLKFKVLLYAFWGNTVYRGWQYAKNITL
jgi:hypothetical protein